MRYMYQLPGGERIFSDDPFPKPEQSRAEVENLGDDKTRVKIYEDGTLVTDKVVTFSAWGIYRTDQPFT